MKECTQEEFYEFIDNYPRELTVDVAGMCEPPKLSYNDFSLGKWPDSVVASCYVFNDDPFYTDVFDVYAKQRNGDRLQAKWMIATTQPSNGN